MNKTNFLKSPVIRSKVQCELADPCSNVLEEIKEHEECSIAGGTMLTTKGYHDGYIIASALLGNKGKVCTATVECQNNCRS